MFNISKTAPIVRVELCSAVMLFTVLSVAWDFGIIILADLLSMLPEYENFSSDYVNIPNLLGVIVFSPLVESVILIWIYNLLSSRIENIVVVAIIISLFFAILHGLHEAIWAITA